MKPRETPPTRGLVAVVWHVLLGFFIRVIRAGSSLLPLAPSSGRTQSQHQNPEPSMEVGYYRRLLEVCPPPRTHIARNEHEIATIADGSVTPDIQRQQLADVVQRVIRLHYASGDSGKCNQSTGKGHPVINPHQADESQTRPNGSRVRSAMSIGAPVDSSYFLPNAEPMRGENETNLK